MKKNIVDKALEIAAKVHETQKRKATNIPYIIHPVGVMLIASKVTNDENILAACLLHDVLEDGDAGVYGEQEMHRDFGPAITEIVKTITKDDSINDWRARNEDYIEQVKRSDNEAAYIVCAADKIHNLRSVLIDHAEIGEELWGRFNAGKDEQKWWYGSILELVQSKMPESMLVSELEELVQSLEML